MLIFILAMSASVLFSWAALAEERPFTVTADMTYASKYMTDGFKVGGDHPVWQPSLGITSPLEGVSAMFWSSLQIDRTNQQYDEYDLMAQYSHDFFERETYAFNIHGYYDYWTYPKSATVPLQLGTVSDPVNDRGNKLHAGISAINLPKIEGFWIVPTYNAYYWLYWVQNRRDLYEGGTHHELLLQAYHELPRLIPGARYLYAGAGGSMNYNDGAFGVQPGWSHSTAQLVIGAYAVGCQFSLSLNRQWSYDPSVDPTNEIWSTLSFSKVF